MLPHFQPFAEISEVSHLLLCINDPNFLGFVATSRAIMLLTYLLNDCSQLFVALLIVCSETSPYCLTIVLC